MDFHLKDDLTVNVIPCHGVLMQDRSLTLLTLIWPSRSFATHSLRIECLILTDNINNCMTLHSDEIVILTGFNHGLYGSTSCCISHGPSPPQLRDPSTDFHETW